MSRRGGRKSESRPAQPSPVPAQSTQRGGGSDRGGRGRGGGGPAQSFQRGGGGDRGGRGRGGGRPGQGVGGRGSYAGAADILVPIQSPPPPPPASSSSAPGPSRLPVSVPPTTSLSQELQQQLTLGTQDPAVAPVSSKAVKFPARPGFGTQGRKCVVRANHFMVQVADKDIHHYDVTITPEVISKKINRDVIAQLTRMYRKSHLGQRILAYDGRKSIYTAGALPFDSKEFIVKLSDKDGKGSSSRLSKEDRQFLVGIKLFLKLDLCTLQQFSRGRHMEAQYILQALDVVLRSSPSENYLVVGRSFFYPSLGPKGELGDGVDYWKGYFQSLRPTQMGLSLNIDTSAQSFYEPILVTDFLAKYFNYRELSSPLSDQDHIKLKKALKGVKVLLTHTEDAKSYKITGISVLPINQLMFTLHGKRRKMSVVQYFREKYKIGLKYTFLPALQAGNDANPIYLPMEISRIVEEQRCTRRLNERQVTALLKATCQRPFDRENSIKEIVRKNNYNGDQFAKEFGIQVGAELAQVDARVLPPPMLNYHESSQEAWFTPALGQWNMINKKMVNGGRVKFWTCVNFSTLLNRDLPFQFCEELVNMCIRKGMEFNPNPVIPIHSASPNQIEKALRNIHGHSTAEIARSWQQGKQLQLLIIILPDATGSYGTIKRICETELGIISQCCQPSQASRLSKQYFENLALKINVKVGGRNTVLNDAIRRRIPHVTDRPTIIIGVDVNHPEPCKDSSPSIAAVVASMDWPKVTKYRASVSAQTHREEIIQDLYSSVQDPKWGLVHGGMIRELLIAFRRSTGHKPHRIIFYRGGVSEGQFSQVLLYEMSWPFL
ncbi:protein argonaute 5-like isoform X1 [Pistacia vera]|uniref:protein argonaute 5-like isoform X1 n=1 Tax=Pistacia vera TaxID=55513 RepID=UPI001262AE1B|nr:protein argonaute 5-like isoform X1 [Pistacia vera]